MININKQDEILVNALSNVKSNLETADACILTATERIKELKEIAVSLLEMCASCAEDLAFSKENCDVELRQQLFDVINKANMTGIFLNQDN